jgi:voltage-gated potassium channel
VHESLGSRAPHAIRFALHLERLLLRTAQTREFRPFLALVVVTLLGGTLFYRIVEGWGLLNSLYFCVVTLATIGYGDVAPTTRLGKAFTILYIFVGVGTLGLFISTVARTTLRQTAFRDLLDLYQADSSDPERREDDSTAG